MFAASFASQNPSDCVCLAFSEQLFRNDYIYIGMKKRASSNNLSILKYSRNHIWLVGIIVAALTLLSFFILMHVERNKSFRWQSIPKEGLLEVQARTLLDDNQRERLDKILTGAITRANVELVISKYMENISWSDMYAPIRTIYDKSGDSTTEKNVANVGGKYEALANLGRESQTYLHHIVNHYDNLADVTVFCQGTAPTRGYKGHRDGGGHLLANSTLHDFILSPTGHFVFTSMMWLPTVAHIIRKGYNKADIPRSLARSRCPLGKQDVEDNVELRLRFDNKVVVRHIAKRCTEEGAIGHCSAAAFWDKFIKLPRPPHDIVFFAQGAVFSVTAAQIRRRPLRDYQDLLVETSRTSDTYAGFFLEWFWFYLVTSEIAPCPVSGKEFEWANHLPYYEHLEFVKRINYIPS